MQERSSSGPNRRTPSTPALWEAPTRARWRSSAPHTRREGGAAPAARLRRLLRQGKGRRRGRKPPAPAENPGARSVKSRRLHKRRAHRRTSISGNLSRRLRNRRQGMRLSAAWCRRRLRTQSLRAWMTRPTGAGVLSGLPEGSTGTSPAGTRLRRKRRSVRSLKRSTAKSLPMPQRSRERRRRLDISGVKCTPRRTPRKRRRLPLAEAR